MKIYDISISKSKKLCVGTGQLEVAQFILVTPAMFTKLLWLPAPVDVLLPVILALVEVFFSA